MENKIEIVISDNASEDDLYSIVKEMKNEFEYVFIKYSRNNKNIGMAKNFLRTVEMARGEFCWIIGSDDFINENGPKTIINIIERYKNIDFISCNFNTLDLKNVSLSENIKDISNGKGTETKYILQRNVPTSSKCIEKFDYLIDPVYENIYLGSMMCGIFRKVVWDLVDKSRIYETSKFDNLFSIYPHCYIYANGFIGQKAFYCGEDLITVGSGAREWSTDTGESYWDSSLPLIYFSILGDMIEEYKKNGLINKQYKKCLKKVSEISGRLLLPIIMTKYILKRNIKDIKYILIKNNVKRYSCVIYFYIGILKSIIKPIKYV
jgi:glycosyltransferase involved in cell wall biosynthesis